MKNENSEKQLVQTTSHGSAKKANKSRSESEQLIEQIPVEGTPFTVVKVEDKWFLAMGKYRLTEPMESKAQALGAAEDKSWFRIIQIIMIIIKQDKQDEKDIATVTRAEQRRRAGLPPENALEEDNNADQLPINYTSTKENSPKLNEQ